jgi:hypothetical protein
VAKAGLREQVNTPQEAQSQQPQTGIVTQHLQQQEKQQQQEAQFSPAGQPVGSSPVVDSHASTTLTTTTTTTTSSSSSSSAAEPQDPGVIKNTFTYFYNNYWTGLKSPEPVQMPPPDAASFPPVRPFFRKSAYNPPAFLQYYAAPPNSSYNFISFLGDCDPNRGKYLAAGAELDKFLTSYFKTVGLANRRMFLAECYQGQPFK